MKALHYLALDWRSTGWYSPRQTANGLPFNGCQKESRITTSESYVNLWIEYSKIHSSKFSNFDPFRGSMDALAPNIADI
jgi:hypothetical protein